MNYWIGPIVKPVWNFVLHMLHNFLGCGIKTRAYHLRKYILHLLLLKISIFISKKFYNTCLSSRRAIVNKVYLLFRLSSLFALQRTIFHGGQFLSGIRLDWNSIEQPRQVNCMGGGLGLVVNGGASKLEGCEFDSWCQLLDGHYSHNFM